MCVCVTLLKMQCSITTLGSPMFTVIKEFLLVTVHVGLPRDVMEHHIFNSVATTCVKGLGTKVVCMCMHFINPSHPFVYGMGLGTNLVLKPIVCWGSNIVSYCRTWMQQC